MQTVSARISVHTAVAARLCRWTYWLGLVLIVLAAIVPLLAFAQGSDQKFSAHKADGSLFGTYDTQEQAAAAIRTMPGPAYATDAYQYVRYIKDSSVSSDTGETTITYWMGRSQPSDPDWSYIGAYAGGPYSSEEEWVEAVKAVASDVECKALTALVPSGEWSVFYPGSEGIYEIRYYALTWYRYSTSTGCGAENQELAVYRSRRLQCPIEYTQWEDAEGACVNLDIVATVKTSASQCDAGLVGNPCDVKTGEKYETETDFDLGWIELTRSYHSGVANASGGFGLGWIDSHRMHLAVHPPAMGLIDGSGYTVPFRQVGSEYHVANGSGERILAEGSNWKLYRQDAVYTFDDKGRLVSRVYEDGNGLVYVYDDYGRLDAVASLQGRSIEFQYADNSGDALITGVLSAGVQLATYTYNNGRLETVTYPDGATRTYHYEDTRFPRHLTGITTEDSLRYSTFAYDDKGRAISSQHAGGADGVALSYSAAGTLVTDALGEQTTYVMTDAGGGSSKVASVTNSAGTEAYTYYDASVDYRRRLDTVTDRNGTQTKHAYAEVTDPVTGQPASIHTVTEAVGLPEQRVTAEVRDRASNRLLSNTVGDREVRYAYNARLQPATMTVKDLVSGQTRVTTFTYCEAADASTPGSTCPIEGLPKTVDGPRTDVLDVTTYAYYPSDDTTCAATPATCPHRKGELWKTTNALGRVTEILTYDGAGRPLSVKDSNGVVTDFEYHPRGWPTALRVRGTDNASEADDRITRIEYWPTGLVKKVTEPDGAFTIYTYDAAQRLTEVTDNAGNSIHYTLDNAGNRLQEDTEDSGGTLRRTLSRVYNQLGQLEILADAQANPTDFAYDVVGNPDTVTDALSRVTDSDYDPLNRLKRTLQDVGGIEAQTQIAYDPLDNPTQVTDPKGLQTTYAYNGFGDLVQQTSPDTGITSYTYDSAGNRKTWTDARRIAAAYGYDALNRVTSISYPDTSLDTAFAYDTAPSVCQAGETFAAGRLSQMADASSSTQYCYDRFGDLVRKVQTTNGQVFTLRYAYSRAGRLSAVTYPDGAVVDYVRNALGQATEVGVTPAGGTRQILLNQASYYPFGPSAGWTYGNGRGLARSYDQDYRPQTILDGASGGLDLGYGFDAVGNLDALTTALGATPLLGFGNDALGRLTQTEDGPTGTPIEIYAYDATGNRTSFQDSAGTQTYVYPATSHRLVSAGGITRTYDAAGNTTSIGGTAREFVYDDTGRMRQAKAGGTVVASYVYNARGERIRRTQGSADTYTLYDEAGRWLGDYDSSGAPLQQAIWLDDLPVGLMAGASQVLHYVEPDHLGTPRAVIDPVRDVAVWRWDAKSEAFGNSPPHQDPDADGTAFVLDMRFPGQRYDSATGLNYNYFRDYDSKAGRYVQSDPIGLMGGASTYTYALSQPHRFFDLFGLDVFLITTYDSILGISYGSHSALFIPHSGGDALFDPAGNYLAGRGRPWGSDVIFGEKANMQAFIAWHKSVGSRVAVTRIKTTPEQNAQMITRAEDLGSIASFNCADAVSAVLGGCGIPGSGWPKDLHRNAESSPSCPVSNRKSTNAINTR